ncbi:MULTISPECIES: RHS repeat-associated core domain-containing protein [unclassified Pseudomonas]|uniref:RHS repeat-associated core domain-containing protein n=2 Tax=unclassified Pseudomonas TaxID=196821 RepID=UPI000D81110C|nr:MULTISPECIES: RHS repeat-associated core domain-containing protein [unclassified Pseudomonas]PYG76383.1 RHS repeat-associated protein [Pseudomonas sp. RV120224-01c]PYG79917.1 RHS repeat-associated protein [Pseudomonas sp. RV120224-01b]
MAASKTLRRFHQNDRVATELSGSETRSIFQHNGSLLAQRTSGSEASHSIIAVNNTNTVISECGLAGKEQFPYTPYGRRPAQSESNNPLAFNGELLDSATGCYSLGNGYRLFSPTLKRFCGPDNLSPFEQGGLNAYAYCAGDPVNKVDPTGHFSLFPTYAQLTNPLYLAGMITHAAGVIVLTVAAVKKSKKLALVGGGLIGIAYGLFYSASRNSPSLFQRSMSSTPSRTPSVSRPTTLPPSPPMPTPRVPSLSRPSSLNSNSQLYSDQPRSYNSLNINNGNSMLPGYKSVQNNIPHPLPPNRTENTAMEALNRGVRTAVR